MLSLPLTLARRYLLARKSTHAINLISGVSMLGIFVGTAALIIILSVFNGFESLVNTLYNKFDPAIKVMPLKGKTFDADYKLFTSLGHIDGVDVVAEVLEENALLRSGENQCIATVKGVGSNYNNVTHINTATESGAFILQDNVTDYIILGAGVAQTLNMRADNPAGLVNIYIPKSNAGSAINPEDAFNQQYTRPAGTFAIQQEFDAQYAFVPISLMRSLLQKDSGLTSYEIGIKPYADIQDVEKRVQEIVGPNFVVKNRYELNDVLYKTMRSEKWAVYAVLLLVIIVASFNMTGSLSMLVMEKKRDIQVLHTMGANKAFIRRVFLSEGLLMCALASTAGLIIGSVVCIIQQVFGLVKLGGATFVIDAYPVQMKPLDFITVWFAVMLIGYAASYFPAHKASAHQHFKL